MERTLQPSIILPNVAHTNGVITVAIDNENSLIEFSLYPNPTNTSFTIEFPEELQLKKVSIYNNLSQLVKTSTLK